MTHRQMAFATAKFWGILPHVIWHYPFRYYRELRDFYLATLRPVPSVRRSSDDPDDIGITVID